jgi:phycocyanobilin lyase subunit beta
MSILENDSAAIASLIQAVEAADSAMGLVHAMENLAATGSPTAIPHLIAAVDGLIRIGEPAVEPILSQLDGRNYTARAWAIRALAGIGDPRGLVTLLGAATADFALSVRRAAAKGLGAMRWHWFPPDLLEIAQEEALEALAFVAQEDEEWVVRYSAVVGLQELAAALGDYPIWRSQIRSMLQTISLQDKVWVVRARAQYAQQAAVAPKIDGSEVPPAIDWQGILQNLYARKGAERTNITEGDPRNYRDLAGSLQNSTDRTKNDGAVERA